MTRAEMMVKVRNAACEVAEVYVGLPVGHPLEHETLDLMAALDRLEHLIAAANVTYVKQLP